VEPLLVKNVLLEQQKLHVLVEVVVVENHLRELPYMEVILDIEF
jgi:hypothetical protein